MYDFIHFYFFLYNVLGINVKINKFNIYIYNLYLFKTTKNKINVLKYYNRKIIYSLLFLKDFRNRWSIFLKQLSSNILKPEINEWINCHQSRHHHDSIIANHWWDPNVWSYLNLTRVEPNWQRYCFGTASFSRVVWIRCLWGMPWFDGWSLLLMTCEPPISLFLHSFFYTFKFKLLFVTVILFILRSWYCGWGLI